MAERPYMDRLDDFDENTDTGLCSCYELMARGLDAYGKQILRVVNGVPAVDRPLVVAALRFVYEAILGSDAQLRDAVEAIEALPIQTLTFREPRKKGGDGNG